MTVTAQNLVWKIGRKAIVDGVSFEVPPGQTLGLLGPNGSGKTSLLRLIAGLPITSIISLHDLNHAAMFCDALMVLQQGRVVAHGTPTEVLTEELLREVFRVEARVMPAEDHPGPHILYLR